MFGRPKDKSSDYSKISLDDFSDDELESPRGGTVELGGHNAINGKHATNGHHGPAASSSSPRQQQQLLMKQQDEGLEMLSQSAERLGKMSMQIHEELGMHNQILDDMDNELDEANENLDTVTRKTKEFIEFTGGEKNCVLILILVAIAVILFLLILYT